MLESCFVVAEEQGSDDGLFVWEVSIMHHCGYVMLEMDELEPLLNRHDFFRLSWCWKLA